MQQKVHYFKWLIPLLVLTLMVWQGNAQELITLDGRDFNDANGKSQGKEFYSLKSTLNKLEEKYQVHFNYASGLIRDKEVKAEDLEKIRESSVEKLLNKLLLPMGLKHEKIDESLYLIMAEKREETIEKIRKNPLRGSDNKEVFFPAKKEAAGISTNQRIAKLIRKEASKNYNLKQQIQVSGTVTSEAGEALPGVNVVIQGSSTGTVTDVNGNYSINAAEDATLVFSFVGYLSRQVPVNGRSSIDVTMEHDVAELEEVVVIGYGTRERKDLTGSISQIETEEITQNENMSPQMAMQGRMPGVNVTSTGGSPNSRPEVRIRGVGTFNDASPLYVVDGVPITEFGSSESASAVQQDIRGDINIFSMINPNDIKSISVLKDASAAAVYGMRAANGVVLIETKEGKKGETQIDFNASRGVQNIPETYDLLNVEEYVNFYQEAYANNTTQSVNMPAVFNPDSSQYLGDRETVRWGQEYLNKNAIVEDYNVRVSGGGDNSTYYVSSGFSRQESPLIENRLDRYTLATNVKSDISDYVRAGLTYRFAYVDALDNTQGNLNNTLNPPWQPIYGNHPSGYAPSVDSTVNYSNDPPTVDYTLLWGPETNKNFFGQMAVNHNDYRLLRNMGNGYVEFEPIDGLKFRGTLSADWYYNRNNSFDDIDDVIFNITPGNPFEIGDGTSEGEYGERHTHNININKEFRINYTKSFGDHNFDVLLNASDQTIRFEALTGSTEQMESDDPDDWGVGGQKEYNNTSTWYNIETLQGYLGRLSYNYLGKYYLDATVRYDGSSQFAPEYRWGTFPSFSAAWRISQENFMQNIGFLDNLKLRGGWGQLGNNETGQAFAYLSGIATGATYAYGSGNGDAIGNVSFGATLPDFPVRDLTWEVTNITNGGFDAVLFDNRLNLTAEYYYKLTEDILQQSNLPASVGNGNPPVLNIANVKNSGFEIQAGYNGNLGEFQYSISGNLTTVNNEVLHVYNDQPFGGQQGRIEEGYPLNYLWGYKSGGIIQDQSKVNSLYQTYTFNQADTLQPGDMWFQDLRGNPDPEKGEEFYSEDPDSVINSNDRVFLGNTIAGHYYGLSFTGGYKGFDFSVFFQGVGNIYKTNSQRWRGESMSSTGINQWSTVKNRWTQENKSTTMPRAVHADPAGNNRFSDRWVENASYVRLKNVQIGYSLPNQLLDNWGFMDKFRIYASGQNIFTFTKWTGLDPEVDSGIPPARIFKVGVNTTF